MGWLGLHSRSYPRRLITNLEAARQRTHDWVLAVRRTSEGRSCVMKDGNDMLVLHDGRVARLITRVDFRTDCKRPVTFQSAETKWDRRQREAPKGSIAHILQEEVRMYNRLEQDESDYVKEKTRNRNGRNRKEGDDDDTKSVTRCKD